MRRSRRGASVSLRPSRLPPVVRSAGTVAARRGDAAGRLWYLPTGVVSRSTTRPASATLSLARARVCSPGPLAPAAQPELLDGAACGARAVPDRILSQESLDRITDEAGIAIATPADDGRSVDDVRHSLDVTLEATACSLLRLWCRPPPEVDPSGFAIDQEAEGYKRPRGRPRNHALATYFDSLIAAYALAFDRQPGVSRDEDKDRFTGPLVRFLGACCTETRAALAPLEASSNAAHVEAVRAALAPFDATVSQGSWDRAIRERVRNSRLHPPIEKRWADDRKAKRARRRPDRSV